MGLGMTHESAVVDWAQGESTPLPPVRLEGADSSQ